MPPTDLELMMLADGELDPGREAEIEAYLAADGALAADQGAARAKLAGLRALSAVVAGTAAWPERAGIDVVDGVLHAIDGDGAASSGAIGRAASRAGADARPTLDGATASRRSGSVAPAAARPANDNARLIYGLAFAAAAAAAAVFVWGNAGAPTGEVQATRAPPVEAPQAAPPRAPATAPRDPVAARPSAPDDARYGVEVASVDFGQRSGAIYYVPAGGPGDDDAAAAAVTTVVWLSDE